MKITVFGLGYVGLVTAACFADTGYKVMGVEINPEKLALLKQGRVPFYEADLDTILKRNIDAGRLSFTSDVAEAVAFSTLHFITVGTPPLSDGRGVDLQYVHDVAHAIGQHINQSSLVVVKSTVPVGTCDGVKKIIADQLNERHVHVDMDVVFNPEFLKEGVAVADFCKPDRIILGTQNPRSIEILKALYAPFNRNHNRTMVMDTRSAELTKYAANAMLATKISFMSEMANLAERLGADIEHVRQGIGADPRIGYHFIYPGCGYGGSCFPKDVQALIDASEKIGYEAHLLKAVEDTNRYQKNVLFAKMIKHFGGAQQLKNKKIAIWGLSFKPQTDDIRDASSLALIKALLEAGARVSAYDPKAMQATQHYFNHSPHLHFTNTKEDSLTQADALAICTEWAEFLVPDFDLLAKQLKQKIIFDGRNLYDPHYLDTLGFTYYGIGRGKNT